MEATQTRWQDTPGVSPAFMEEMLAWKLQMDHQLTAWAREMENLRLSFTSPALNLGPGQFGHSGKPAAKPAKLSKIELRETYMLANRAIHTQRAKFFKLKPQEKKIKLITFAKTLAKLVSAKNRAHKKLIKASRPKFSHEARILLKWRNPTGGNHALLKQKFIVSQRCQPLQLPFQLLWPPDCHQPEPNQRNSKMESECLPEE